MEVFTIEACEEVLVVRRVLVRSHEADEFRPCACLDKNTRREDGVGKPLCVSKREGWREGEGEGERCRVSIPPRFLQAVGYARCLPQ